MAGKKGSINNADFLSQIAQSSRNSTKEVHRVLAKAKEEELVEIEGFGEIIAHSIYQYFHNEKDMELLQKVLQYITFTEPEEAEQENLRLHQLSFVITGDLKQFANRKELQKKIEYLGGKVTNSVTKKTTCLINNDTTSNSSKNKKAKELEIPILDENEFIKKYLSTPEL